MSFISLLLTQDNAAAVHRAAFGTLPRAMARLFEAETSREELPLHHMRPQAPRPPHKRTRSLLTQGAFWTQSPADGTAHLCEDVAADGRVRLVHHRLGHAEQHSQAVERRHVIVAEGLILQALLQLGAVDVWGRGGR